jgi:hypothetical protein
MHYEDDALNIIAPLGVHHKGFLRGSFLRVIFPRIHYTFCYCSITYTSDDDAARFTTGLIFPSVLSLELYELTFTQVFFSNSCFVFANAHQSLKLLLPHWEYEITRCL